MFLPCQTLFYGYLVQDICLKEVAGAMVCYAMRHNATDSFQTTIDEKKKQKKKNNNKVDFASET